MNPRAKQTLINSGNNLLNQQPRQSGSYSNTSPLRNYIALNLNFMKEAVTSTTETLRSLCGLVGSPKATNYTQRASSKKPSSFAKIFLELHQDWTTKYVELAMSKTGPE